MLFIGGMGQALITLMKSMKSNFDLEHSLAGQNPLI